MVFHRLDLVDPDLHPHRPFILILIWIFFFIFFLLVLEQDVLLFIALASHSSCQLL